MIRNTAGAEIKIISRILRDFLTGQGFINHRPSKAKKPAKQNCNKRKRLFCA
jgi:hypothetical protein